MISLADMWPVHLQVMAAAMDKGDDVLRLRACDVLLAAGQHDPQPLRAYIEGGEGNRRLLSTLIQTLGTPNENGLQEQVACAPLTLSPGSGTFQN